jgi:hypothetical protein
VTIQLTPNVNEHISLRNIKPFKRQGWVEWFLSYPSRFPLRSPRSTLYHLEFKP